jgi:hypothetical protein
LTHSSQLAGKITGPGCRRRKAASPSAKRHAKLDQGQSSARRTNPARTGLRST